MARSYSINFKEDKPIISRHEKWNRGLNTLVSSTQIRPEELSEAQDIQLVEDGKIQCPRDGQVYFGNSSGSRVTGLFPYYKSDGTKALLRTSATKLQKFNSSTSGWDDVSGYTYTTTLNTEAVMAYDRLYICNGTDPLTYYDGSSITSFTAISAPAAPTVTRTGSSGSYTFSYKITAVTSVGETTGSTAGSTTLNQATLDNTSYMSVSWSAVTNAIGYNVYGRKDGKWFFIKYLEGNSSTSYVDKNTDTPLEYILPPEGNSTAGPAGKYIAQYKDSLFIAGDPNNPSRLYYSGGGDKIHDFTVDSGGGLIDVAKNDGQIITGIIVFKNTLLVFKQDSIYRFSYTSDGLPQIEQINPSVGAIAPRSIVAVENDVFFASRRGIFTIGNEAGFSFDVLRTNELSAKIRSIYQTIDPAYIQNVAGVYATVANKNLVIFSYTPAGSTTNAKAIVYDRERLAWYKWSNINANCWTQYVDSDGDVHVLYGDDSSGYVKEALVGSDDFGTAIRGYFSIKAETFGALERFKNFKNVHMVLRKPNGNITLRITIDGVGTAYTANIGTISPTINFKHYLFKDFLFKDVDGTGVSEPDTIVTRRLRNINLSGKSILLNFDNNGSSGSFTLLGVVMEAKMKSQHYYGSGEVVN